MPNIKQKIKNVPNKEVPKRVELIKADPRYVSHKVIDQGNGKSTIEVVLKQD